MALNLVKNLPDSYVQYELICRRVDIKLISARDRKKLLAKFLSDERTKPPIRFNSYLSPDVDCAEVQRLYGRLKDEYYQSTDKDTPERILDCISFLRVRMDRIRHVSDLQRVLLTDLEQKLNALEQELSDAIIDLGDTISELSFSVDTSSAQGMICQNVTKQSPKPSSVAVITDTSRHKLKVPVHKWDIKFSGKKGTLSAVDFINRVNDYQVSKHVTDEELFSSFSDLLEGDAYTWFRALRNLGPRAPCTWTDLKGKLLIDYEKNLQDFMFDLEHSIRVCVQTEDVSVIVFFALIEEKFVQLCTFKLISQDEQVRIIRRNLLPAYREALAFQSFATVDDLKMACKQLEEIYLQNSVMLSKESTVDNKNRHSKFVTFDTHDEAPPVLSRNSLTGQDARTLSVDSKPSGLSVISRSVESRRTTPNPFSRQIFSEVRRDRSQSPRRNDDAGETPKSRKSDLSHIVCFRCGNPGHYANKCPNSGNANGSWRTGSSTAPVVRTDPR